MTHYTARVIEEQIPSEVQWKLIRARYGIYGSEWDYERLFYSPKTEERILYRPTKLFIYQSQRGIVTSITVIFEATESEDCHVCSTQVF